MPDPSRTFDGPPSTALLYGKAALGSLPLAGNLPFLAGGGGDIPDAELVMKDVATDPDRLAEYCRVCDFPLGNTLPATYPHMLAFPLHMSLMTSGDFPFGAVGLVHVTNRIVHHRPIAVTETLEIRVRSGQLQPHPKGRTFTIVTEALIDGEVVWEAESTNLRRGKGDESAKDPGLSLDPGLKAESEWHLGGDLGRRYGGVSGDRNPIHLYGLTAKALGFPRQIAHGMWTKARCLAALDSRLPDSFQVDVAFKRPILLPGKVEMVTGDPAGSGALDFGVRSPKDGTPHLAARVAPLSDNDPVLSSRRK